MKSEQSRLLWLTFSTQVPGRWEHWESAESSASDHQRLEPQEGCRVKLKTQGVGMEAPQPQLTGLYLVPPLQLALGCIGKYWPAQGPPDFRMEGVKEMWSLIYRLALHQRVEMPGMTFAQSCMRSVAANYPVTDNS